MISLPRSLQTLFVAGLFGCAPQPAAVPDSAPSISPESIRLAEQTLRERRQDVIATLGQLVRFKTVHDPAVANAENPEFRKMTEVLKETAGRLGLDFQDHGAVVVIGLGDSTDRLGIVTHGDVQPADPSKWAKSPFELDPESDPGKLVGRGTEDDKGPIAIALHAMKALADSGLPLKRRVELIVSYTEESDWAPMIEFLRSNPPPQLNIALDSRYPVVTAEKGFGLIQLSLPAETALTGPGPILSSFRGGAFITQVPEDAVAEIAKPGPDLAEKLKSSAALDSTATFSFEARPDRLVVHAKGKSAHSSEPEEGVNAISHLAALLGGVGWSPSPASSLVRFINECVGTGHEAEKFGSIAFRHDFMGPLTMSLGTVEEKDGRIEMGVNIRIPAGKEKARLESEIRDAVDACKRSAGIGDASLTLFLGDPHLVENAPHVPTLLRVFGHFTGTPDPQALSAGGGTHARLLPNGVSFGPHMPHRAYSGHTEHEFLSLDELDLDIRIYTAMLVELTAR